METPSLVHGRSLQNWEGNWRGDPRGNVGESRIPNENGDIESKLVLLNPGSPGAGRSSQYSPGELTLSGPSSQYSPRELMLSVLGK